MCLADFFLSLTRALLAQRIINSVHAIPLLDALGIFFSPLTGSGSASSATGGVHPTTAAGEAPHHTASRKSAVAPAFGFAGFPAAVPAAARSTLLGGNLIAGNLRCRNSTAAPLKQGGLHLGTFTPMPGFPLRGRGSPEPVAVRPTRQLSSAGCVESVQNRSLLPGGVSGATLSSRQSASVSTVTTSSRVNTSSRALGGAAAEASGNKFSASGTTFSASDWPRRGQAARARSLSEQRFSAATEEEGGAAAAALPAVPRSSRAGWPILGAQLGAKPLVGAANSTKSSSFVVAGPPRAINVVVAENVAENARTEEGRANGERSIVAGNRPQTTSKTSTSSSTDTDPPTPSRGLTGYRETVPVAPCAAAGPATFVGTPLAYQRASLMNLSLNLNAMAKRAENSGTSTSTTCLQSARTVKFTAAPPLFTARRSRARSRSASQPPHSACAGAAAKSAADSVKEEGAPTRPVDNAAPVGEDEAACEAAGAWQPIGADNTLSANRDLDQGKNPAKKKYSTFVEELMDSAIDDAAAERRSSPGIAEKQHAAAVESRETGSRTFSSTAGTRMKQVVTVGTPGTTHRPALTSAIIPTASTTTIRRPLFTGLAPWRPFTIGIAPAQIGIRPTTGGEK